MSSQRGPGQHASTTGIWALGVLVMCLAGCHGGQIFSAKRLPPELIAPRIGSLRNIDLSKISRSVGNSEVLHPGDVIRVTITTGIEDQPPEGWELRIGENGLCGVPLIGPVPIAGSGISDAEGRIRDESIKRGVYVNPNVGVALLSRRSNRVTVAGAVGKPGTYEIPASQSDLLGALMHAEGTSDDAGTIIEIRHPPGFPPGAGPAAQFAGFPGSSPGHVGARTMRIDLEQVAAEGGGDFRLHDGSTVMVMKKPKRFVHVIGLVKKADQFELPDEAEVRLLDAIAMAGGLTLEMADKVHVIRSVPIQGEPVVIEASIRAAKSDGISNIRLAAGDVVSVEETPTTFVVGTIRDFVRFGFTAGVPGL